MAKRIAFIGVSGATYEACPFDDTYPANVITISETAEQGGDLALFEKTDVSDSFDTSGRCKIYKAGVFVFEMTFDRGLYQTFLAGDGLEKDSDGTLKVKVDDSTLEISSDTVQVKDGGITPTKTSFAEDYS